MERLHRKLAVALTFPPSILFALLTWGTPHTRAQAASTSSPSRAPTLQTTSTLVVVPTLVESASGDLVHALRSTDFRLTDNDVAQAVTLEDVESDPAERQPLSVIVLLQTGASASRQFPSYANIATMLDAIVAPATTGSAKHQAALVTFDSQPEDIWDFTANLSDLKDGFTHPRQGDGKAAIFDAVSYAVDLLRQQPAGSRRLLLLISQTQDAGSRIKMDEVVRRLGENNITIVSVAFSPEKAWLKDEFTKPRHGNPPYAMPNHEPLIYTFNLSTPLGMALKAMETNAASTIASLSGGEYLPFSDRRGLERQLSLLANHIPNRYMLTFRPTSAAPGFHTLRVEVTGRPDLQVAARTSYWASPSGPQ